MGRRVALDIDNQLYFGTIIQYDAEVVHWLVEFDDGDTDYYNCIELCVVKQSFKDNTNNDNTNNDKGEH